MEEEALRSGGGLHMPVSTGRTQICSVQNTLERWRDAKQTPVRHLYPSALQVKTEAIGLKKKKKRP